MEHRDCINCNFSSFANLYYKEIAGGELFVLEESIKQKKITPCEVMIPPDCCFQLLLIAYNEIGFTPFLFLTWQCIYDLKASAFLSLTAHYRSATQLLRPVIENVLIACYFEEKLRQASNDADRDAVWSDFEGWTKEEYRIAAAEYSDVMGKTIKRDMPLDFGYAKTWLKQNGTITGPIQSRLDDLKGQLNKYIHPHFSRMEIGDADSIRFPAIVKYDKDLYDSWADSFQNINCFIIEKIINYYPFIRDSTEANEALAFLKMIESVESDIGRPIMKSRYLREFVAQLPKDDSEKTYKDVQNH